MKVPQENTQESKQETVQRVQKESSTGGEATIVDNRFATAAQRKLRVNMYNRGSKTQPIQKKNKTGLPDHLKSGIENLSGYSMDDVKVHYNSSKPAQLQAHAYAQGTDIHLAPGQEKHLPHEAWHVVQQKQGRVKPTRQLKSNVNINDDTRLEKEADVMGDKCLGLTNNFNVIENKAHTDILKGTKDDRVVQKKDLIASMDNGKIGSIYEDWGRYRLTHKSGPAKKELEQVKVFRFQIDEKKFKESFGRTSFPNNDKFKDFFKEDELRDHIEKKKAIPDWATPIKGEDDILEKEDKNFKLYELYYKDGKYEGDHPSRGALVKVPFDEESYEIIEISVAYAEDQVRIFKRHLTTLDTSFQEVAGDEFYDQRNRSNILEGWIGNRAFLESLRELDMFYFLIDYFRTNEEIYGKETHDKLKSFVAKVENAKAGDILS